MVGGGRGRLRDESRLLVPANAAETGDTCCRPCRSLPANLQPSCTQLEGLQPKCRNLAARTKHLRNETKKQRCDGDQENNALFWGNLQKTIKRKQITKPTEENQTSNDSARKLLQQRHQFSRRNCFTKQQLRKTARLHKTINTIKTERSMQINHLFK